MTTYHELMRKPIVFAAFALLSAVGAAIIAVPDTDPGIALSDTHGPGLLDGAGIVVLLAGSSILWGYLWAARDSLIRSPSRLHGAWFFGAGLGTGLIVASVANDFGGWWAMGAAVLLAVQLSLFVEAKARPVA
jgi:hypothetical protein